MTPKEFVRNFYIEKNKSLNLYLSSGNETEVSHLISQLQLDTDKNEIIKQLVDSILTDTFYTVLLGLDGAASIGDEQHIYEIFDEDGNELSGGEIEAYAYEYFHGYTPESEI